MTPTFTPSRAFPFLVVVIDELAFLTAYQPERDLRKRAEAVRVRAGGEDSIEEKQRLGDHAVNVADRVGYLAGSISE